MISHGVIPAAPIIIMFLDESVESDTRGNFAEHESHFNTKDECSLPINKHAMQIAYSVWQYPVTLVIGPTGSGKSTQLPQIFLLKDQPQQKHSAEQNTQKENAYGEDPFLFPGHIICVEPRRAAAVALSARVAQELQTQGLDPRLVGHTVRFEDTCIAGITRIHYMTDGMLLRQIMWDPCLSTTSIVILDEVHERSVGMEILCGLLKRLQHRQRPQLRIILASATMDVACFGQFFWSLKEHQMAKKVVSDPSQNEPELEKSNDLAISKKKPQFSVKKPVYIPKKTSSTKDDIPPLINQTKAKAEEETNDNGNLGVVVIDQGLSSLYPVSIYHLARPLDPAQDDYCRVAVETVLGANLALFTPQHPSKNDARICTGDTLVFVPGVEEIKRIAEMLHERTKDDSLEIFPLHAGLTLAQQMAVVKQCDQIKDSGKRSRRRVIVATNIAEASLTVEGLEIVVDCGLQRSRVHEAVPGTFLAVGHDRMLTEWISKASAKQRAGRVARVGPGKVFRLYTEEELFREHTTPSLHTCDLVPVIAQLLVLGVKHVGAFPLPSGWSPAKNNTVLAVGQLNRLGFLQTVEDAPAAIEDDQGSAGLLVWLGEVGKALGDLPLGHPSLAMLLWVGALEGVLEECTALAAILSLPEALPSILGCMESDKGAKAKFAVEQGDLLTVLNVTWSHLKNAQPSPPSSLKSVLSRIAILVKNFKGHLARVKHLLPTPDSNTPLKEGTKEKTSNSTSNGIQRAVCAAFAPTAARADPRQGCYHLLLNPKQAIHIHPTSVLFHGRLPDMIVAYKLEQTSSSDGRIFAQGISTVDDLEWLVKGAPELYRLVPKRRRG